MMLDAACASGSAALHQARLSLLAGETQVCIVGGVSTHVHPGSLFALSAANMRSTASTGACRVFDDEADGYIPSEGAVAVIIARASYAAERGLTARAALLGSAVQHIGASSDGMLAPCAQAEARVMRAALASSRRKPCDVGAIELHGTGTQQGDAAEAAALADVFAKSEKDGDAVLLQAGSIKTICGHTEEASGLVGMLKAILMLENMLVPPFLLRGAPSTAIDWANVPFRLNHTTERLRSHKSIIINSFGAFGSVSSLVVAGSDSSKTAAKANGKSKTSATVLSLSAPSRKALIALRDAWVHKLRSEDCHGYSVQSMCTALTQLTHSHRLAIAVPSDMQAEKAAALLSAQEGTACGGSPAEVCFIFTGQAQAVSFSAIIEQLQTSAVSKASLEECDSALRPITGWSLLEKLSQDTSDHPQSISQPAAVAVEVAIAQLLGSFGITPAFALGHSLGAIAAAAVASKLSVRDACALAWKRGSLIDDAGPAARGKMLAAELGIEEAEDTLLQRPDLSIAAQNGPTATVFSGPACDIDDLQDFLRQRRIRSITVNSVYNFHSHRLEVAASQLAEWIDKQSFDLDSAQRATFISDLVGARVPTDVHLCGAYWARHLSGTLRFDRAVDCATNLTAGGEAAPLVVEISTAGPSLRRHLQKLGGSYAHAANSSGHLDLSQVLACAYNAGVPVHWDRRCGSDGPRAPARLLPKTPFIRQPLWPLQQRENLPSLARNVSLPLQWPPSHTRVSETAREYDFKVGLSEHRFLSQHRFNGQPTLPVAL